MLKINVSTAEAVVTETELITAGRKGLKCAFSFNSAWDGLQKTAVFQGVVTRDIALLSGNETVVPAECIAKAQFPLKIGVYGAKPDGTVAIPTIWASFGKVLPGTKPSNIQPDELTPDVVAQIQEAASNALYLARNVQSMADSGAFDGEDGFSPSASVSKAGDTATISITDENGTTSATVTDGTDGVSPTISSETITGGHRLTIVDAEGTTTVDVMDGEDATIDATLSNAGEAADAAETGKVKHTADYARLYAETLNSGAALPLDAEWELYDISGARAYRIHTSDRIVAAAVMTLQIESGYRFFVRTYSSGSYTDSNWYGPAYSSRNTYTIAAGTDFRVVISAYPEDSSVVLTDEDVAVYAAQISIKNNISSGGGGGGSVSPYTSNPAALGTASPGSSDNYARGDHVHPKPTAADIGAGTYSKPSGGIPYSDLSSSVQISLDAADAAYQFPANGIPKTDLASDVQTSLGKADTALQSAPVTSVNGQTGAVSLSIPSTASDVGAVAVSQGVAHAGEFCVVGSDGNITTVTMTAWQGGSY